MYIHRTTCVYYIFLIHIFVPFQIAVVVLPEPEELKFRSNRRFQEMGKEVPADAVNNMLGILQYKFCHPLPFKAILFSYLYM